MTELGAVLVVGLGTYASRAVFIIALANREIPPAVLQSLQYVAPAVLSALIVALLIDGDGNVALGLPETVGLVAGGAVAFKTRNHILTLIVGMTVFWVVQALT
jgi:branched-subunit amino acid transport protein